MLITNINWVPFVDICNASPEKKFILKMYQWCDPTDSVVTFEEETDANTWDCADTITCINQQLLLPWAWALSNFKEAAQDAVWEAFEWFDYNDVLNQWLMENPFPIKHTIQASNGVATLNPDDIINFVLDNTVSDIEVDETVPTFINVKIPTKAPYVKALENPTANIWTAIIHNLNTPVPSLYAYDSANEYISLERKFVDDNTIEYRTTTNDPFTYYIKS